MLPSNFKIQLPPELMSIAILVVVILFILWAYTLISAIRHQAMKDADRIIWVIVLCLTHVVGMVLYWIFAPGDTSRPRTDQELKDYFNKRAE